MADPVSITLGVLPLVGGALNAYRLIRSKLKTFSRYYQEISRARRLLERQQDFFLNETHLLLRLVLDDPDIVSMTEDAKHVRWESLWLDEDLRGVLGRNYTSCGKIIEDIGKIMSDVQQQLECLDALVAERREDERLKDTCRRLKGRVKTAIKKSKIDELIDNLRDANDDLKKMREHVTKLQQVDECSAKTCALLKRASAKELSSFSAIRQASTALHEALSTAWSSTESVQKHLVKLFVDARAEEEVFMDLIILCCGHGRLISDPLQAQLIQLQVRSQIVSMGLLTAPAGGDRRSQKRRKVKFADDCTSSRDAKSVLPSGEEESHPPMQQANGNKVENPLDPRCCPDICSELAWRARHGTPEHSSSCLGHIDTVEESLRHSFYGRCEECCSQEQRRDIIKPGDLVSLAEILIHPIDCELTVVDQLKLARNLVTLVLKFHSTPWLREYWTIRDLSFFARGQEFSESLRTLHLGIEFVHSSRPGGGIDQIMDDIGTKTSTETDPLHQAVEDARLQYGVRNTVLYSLGVALLQIGRWQTVDPHSVIDVRKLSRQVPTLGPKYQELTKRLLDCDFGFGEDLSMSRLQQAVQEGVLHELSLMIEAMDIRKA